MAFNISPRVNIYERDISIRVDNNGATVGAMCGSTSWGEVEKPQSVNSESEFIKRYHKPDPNNNNNTSQLIAADFLRYGGKLLYNRVVGPKARNSVVSTAVADAGGCEGATSTLDVYLNGFIEPDENGLIKVSVKINNGEISGTWLGSDLIESSFPFVNWFNYHFGAWASLQRNESFKITSVSNNPVRITITTPRTDINPPSQVMNDEGINPTFDYFENTITVCLAPTQNVISCEGATSKLVLPTDLYYGDEDVIYWDIKVGDTLYPLHADGWWREIGYLEDMINEHEVLSQLLRVSWENEQGLVFMNKTQGLLKISLIASQDIGGNVTHDGSNPTIEITGAVINFCLSKSIPEIDLVRPSGGIYFPYTPNIQGYVVVGIVSGDILEIEVSSPTMPTQTVSVTANDVGDIGNTPIDLSNYPIGGEVTTKAVSINGSSELISNTIVGNLIAKRLIFTDTTKEFPDKGVVSLMAQNEEIMVAACYPSIFSANQEDAFRLCTSTNGKDWQPSTISIDPTKTVVMHLERVNGNLCLYTVYQSHYGEIDPGRPEDPRFISTSVDGINWSTVTLTTNRVYTPFEEVPTFQRGLLGFYPVKVVYGNGVYVAAEPDGLQWSLNGSSYVQANVPNHEEVFKFPGGTLFFDGEKFIAFTGIEHRPWHTGRSYSNYLDWTIYVLTSTNGIDWTVVHSPTYTRSQGPEALPLVCGIDGVYMYTQHYAIENYISNDGVNWRLFNDIPQTVRILSVSLVNGKYFALGSDLAQPVHKGIICTSDDGVTWTYSYLQVQYVPPSLDLQSIMYLDGTYALFGHVLNGGVSQGAFYTSVDGVNWGNWGAIGASDAYTRDFHTVFKDQIFNYIFHSNYSLTRVGESKWV